MMLVLPGQVSSFYTSYWGAIWQCWKWEKIMGSISLLRISDGPKQANFFLISKRHELKPEYKSITINHPHDILICMITLVQFATQLWKTTLFIKTQIDHTTTNQIRCRTIYVEFLPFGEVSMLNEMINTITVKSTKNT